MFINVYEIKVEREKNTYDQFNVVRQKMQLDTHISVMNKKKKNLTNNYLKYIKNNEFKKNSINDLLILYYT